MASLMFSTLDEYGDDELDTFLGIKPDDKTELDLTRQLEDSMYRSRNSTTEFCNQENIGEYLEAVNAKLSLHGDRGGLNIQPLLQSPELTPVAVSIVNSVYGIVRKLDLERSAHQRTADENQRCLEEIETLHEKVETLQTHLDESQSSVAHAHRCTESLRNEYSSFKQETRSQKENFLRQIASLSSRETQFKHESNRKERQIECLKEKIRGTQVSKNRTEKQSMQLLTSIMQKSIDENEANPPVVSQPKKILAAKESEIQSLRSENKKLRECLFVVVSASDRQSEIVKIVAEGRGVEDAFAEIGHCEMVSKFLSIQDPLEKQQGMVKLSRETFQLPVQYLQSHVRREVKSVDDLLFVSLESIIEENAKSLERALLEERENEDQLNEYDLQIELHKKDFAISSLREENGVLKEALEKTRVKFGELQRSSDTQVQQFEARKAEVEVRVTRSQQEVQELMEALNLQQQDVAKWCVKVEELQKEREDLMKTHQKQTDALMGQIDQHTNDRKKMMGQLQQLEEQLKKIEVEKTVVEEEADQLSVELQDTRSSLEESRSVLEMKEKQLADCVVEVKRIKEHFMKTQSQSQSRPQPHTSSRTTSSSSRTMPSRSSMPNKSSKP